LSFLAERYNQLKDELLNQDLFKPFTVADYYFSKSLIFSNATLSGHEYNLFRQLFDIMSLSVPVPDLYVYLFAKTEKLLEHKKKRKAL
jgi:deoxyguanosine kinase